MSLHDELAGLKQRLISDTGDRRAVAERRILDVEAAIAAQAPVAETTEADQSDVETAAIKVKRGR